VTGNFRQDDRVLLLAIPSRNELAGIARVLTSGVLVAVGTREEVDSARASMVEFENVMFIEARPDQIPWREAYFTKIIVPVHLEPVVEPAGAELRRLLAPGGVLLHQGTYA
jgi:hypothetical protein